MSYNEASEEDWVIVQGGKPEVSQNGKLTVIHHKYPGGGNMIVRSFISIAKMGSVLLEVGTKTVLFPIALLRMFHGDPCERQSAKNGAKGRYDRSK